MEYSQKKELLNDLYNKLVASGKVSNKKELAQALGVSYPALCNAFGSDEKSLTMSLISKVRALLDQVEVTEEGKLLRVNQIPLLPIEARGGTLNDYSVGIMCYECEKVVSPVKGADFAIQVTGDSMSPDYPSGCHVFIKKVDESIFIEWGKVYVLDTANGIVIKQIQPTDDDEVIQCVSLNPKYAPYKIRKEYIYGWYSILLVMALK